MFLDFKSFNVASDYYDFAKKCYEKLPVGKMERQIPGVLLQCEFPEWMLLYGVELETGSNSVKASVLHLTGIAVLLVC